jgi:hypothetical protein
MSKYKVLYYPHFQPRSRWLLSILLLTDQVDRIVPLDADPDDPDFIKELVQEVPGVFVSKSPKTEDIDLDNLTLRRLKQAFRYIRKQSFQGNKRQIRLSVQRGTLEIEGHTFLHQAKVAPVLRELLIEEGMLDPSLEMMTSAVGIQNYYPVPEQASNLILSCIADKIARREGLDTVTDEELDFTMTSTDCHNVALGRPTGSADGALISAIARVTIPQEIEFLDIRAYKDLRESYAAIREAFKGYVTEISAVERLGRIEDAGVLSDKINGSAEKIRRECDAYTKSAYARRFKSWAPFAVWSMLTIGATIARPTFGLVFAAGTVSLELLKRVFIEPRRGMETPGVIRLLAGMRKDIIGRATIDAVT